MEKTPFFGTGYGEKYSSATCALLQVVAIQCIHNSTPELICEVGLLLLNIHNHG